VSLTQLIGTMHKICKVGVQTPATTKKKSPFDVRLKSKFKSNQKLFQLIIEYASAI